MIFTPTSPRPAHAKDFRGGAKIIPAQNLVFLPYQMRYLSDESQLIVVEKSRRTGFTYVVAYKDARYHSQAGSVYDTWVSSRDEASAKLFAADTLRWAKGLDAAGTSLGERVLDDGRGGKSLVSEIRFRNGTTLHSLSSNYDAFRGKGGNVRQDEFAFRKDGEEAFGVSISVTDWGGNAVFFSSHSTREHYFSKLCDEIRNGGNPKQASLHRVTIEDALNDGLLWKLQTVWPAKDPRQALDEAGYFQYLKDRAPNESVFRREYMCEPEDESERFIPYGYLQDCYYRPGQAWQIPAGESTAGRRFTIGGDIARTRHFTVFTVLEWIGGQAWTREIVRLQNCPFDQQEAALDALVKRYDPEKIMMDQSGIGRQMAENATRRYGAKFEGVQFTPAMKDELAYPVRVALESGGAKLPEDKILTAAFLSIKRVISADKTRVLLQPTETEAGHGDDFWAWALAYAGGRRRTYAAPPRPLKNAALLRRLRAEGRAE